MPEQHSTTKRPQEFYIDAKWDKVIDTGLRRTVYGAAAGGLAALVLFRESKFCCDVGSHKRLGLSSILRLLFQAVPVLALPA